MCEFRYKLHWENSVVLTVWAKLRLYLAADQTDVYTSVETHIAECRQDTYTKQ